MRARDAICAFDVEDYVLSQYLEWPLLLLLSLPGLTCNERRSRGVVSLVSSREVSSNSSGSGSGSSCLYFVAQIIIYIFFMGFLFSQLYIGLCALFFHHLNLNLIFIYFMNFFICIFRCRMTGNKIHFNFVGFFLLCCKDFLSFIRKMP